MTRRLVAAAALIAALFSFGRARVWGAENYRLDGVHSSVTFKISHLGLSWVYGRFDQFEGRFAVDAENPANCSFALSIIAASVDTNNAQRDSHLKSPDFFNAKQFPVIRFKSANVRPTKQGYEVTGNLTLHGVTKPITLQLVGGGKKEFPKGTQRTGFSTELVLKRTDFGMDKAIDAIGDDVHVAISFEGTAG